MDTKKIINEWFYRLPNGYANYPYSDEELTILHKVLEENDFQLDQAFLNAEPVKDEDDTTSVNELSEEWISEEEIIAEAPPTEAPPTEAPPTSDELSAILADTDRKFSPKVLARVADLLNIDTLSAELVEKEMINILGSDAGHVDDILDIVMAPGTDQAKFATYMQNRSISYTDFMGSPESIVSTFSPTGLSSKAIQQLALFKWSAMPAIGALEVLLALLLKNGQRPQGKEAGDLRASGKAIEIKGWNARLKGQKGFGSSASVRKGFIQGYTRLIDELGLDIEVPTDQAVYGSGQWLNTLDNLNEQLIGQLAKDQLADAMAMGFVEAYQRLSIADFDWIATYIGNDGKINRGGFIRKLAEVAFEYYISVEDIDVFAVANATIDKSGPSIANAKIIMFDPSQFPTYLGSQIGIVMPSYNDSAGPQGVAFGLKLGSKTKVLQ